VIVLASAPSAIDQPGTLAFVIIFGMAVVLFFLFRSMSKHLRKVNDAARREAEEAARREAAESGSPPVGEAGDEVGLSGPRGAADRRP
jgi:cobalamin biosynthesis protein CobD/CbiB